MVHPDFLLTTAAAGVPNGRGHAWQDRWSTGQLPHGGWLIVADGITGGTRGETAAATAVAIADRMLLGTDLLEGAVLAAVDAAHAAVRPWYSTGHGGTTLTVLTLTRHRLVLATVGDSPAHLLRDGTLRPLTSPRQAGPLTEWIGQPAPLSPHLQSWPVEGETLAVVCSDGVAPDGAQFPPAAAPADVVRELLRRRSPNHDDATATAIHLLPLQRQPQTN